MAQGAHPDGAVGICKNAFQGITHQGGRDQGVAFIDEHFVTIVLVQTSFGGQP